MKNLKSGWGFRFALVLCVFAMASFTACKKGDDAAKKGDQPAAEAKKGEAKPEAKKGEAKPEAKTAEAKPEAKTAEAKKVEAKPEAKPAATPAVPGKAVAVQAIPKNVIAYGSGKSFTDVMTMARTVADKVSPMPMGAQLDQMALQGMQQGLGFTNLDWMAKDKPVRFVVLNPKVNPNPTILVVPATDAAKVKAALPAEKTENDAGNQFGFKHMFQTTYVNIVGDAVVLTYAPEAFAQVKDFLSKTLTSHVPSVPLEITVAMDNILEIFKAELAMAEAQMAQMAAMQAGLPIPGMVDVMKKEYELIFKGIREMQRIDMAFQYVEGRVSVPMTFTMKQGGGVSTAIAGMLGRNVTLAELLPAASYMVMAYNIDPKVLKPWTELGFDFYGKLLKAEGEELAKLRAMYDKSIAMTTGEGVFAVYNDGKIPFAFEGISGVTDGAAARTNTLEFYALLWNKLIALGKEMAAKEGEQIPPNIDLSSFDKALASVAPMLTPMGVTVALKAEEYKGTKIDLIDLQLDFTKMPGLSERERKEIEPFVGNRVQLAMAFGPKFMMMAAGSDAVARIKAVADGQKPLAADASFGAAAKQLAAGGTGMFYVDAIKGVQAFSNVPDLAPKKAAIDGMKSTGGFALTTKAMAANQLKMTIDVPVDPIAALVKVFAGM